MTMEEEVQAVANKPLPRIFAGICEFCGVKAVECAHVEEYRKAGLLNKGEAAKELAKIYQNFPGLPRVINRICEFCGVDAQMKPTKETKIVEGKEVENTIGCIHYEQRAALAFKSGEPSKRVVEKEGSALIEETQIAGDPVEIEPSGDPEMDKLMDKDDELTGVQA